MVIPSRERILFIFLYLGHRNWEYKLMFFGMLRCKQLFCTSTSTGWTGFYAGCMNLQMQVFVVNTGWWSALDDMLSMSLCSSIPWWYSENAPGAVNSQMDQRDPKAEMCVREVGLGIVQAGSCTLMLLQTNVYLVVVFFFWLMVMNIKIVC